MFEKLIVSGITAYVLKEVQIPSCFVGEPIKDSGYCISRQSAEIKIDFVTFSRKMNTNLQDTKIIIDLEKYGSFSFPYKKDGILIEYRINFN
jgi:hypothetical protein